MNKIVHGIIRGKTIELTEDPGVADGQEVEVQFNIVRPKPAQPLHSRVAGALQDDEEWDQIMEEIHQMRKRSPSRPADFE